MVEAGLVSGAGDTPYRKSYPSSIPSKRVNKGMNCNFCGRPSHMEVDCWRRNGACIICGDSSHMFRGCPKFDPNFRRGRGISDNSNQNKGNHIERARDMSLNH